MGLFNWLLKRKEPKTYEIEHPAESETHVSTRKDTVLRISRRLFESDSVWEDISTFRCENGLVYLSNRKADTDWGTMGEYKEISPGEWEVYYGGIKIATIYEKYQMAIFTLEELYDRRLECFSVPPLQFIADKLKKKKPAVMTWAAIRWSGDKNGVIRDCETIGEIGQFDGKGVEAVAAFALWAYDATDDNKYSDFFTMPH